MDKNAIKKYAVWARNELIARVMQKAAQYGITEEALTTDDDSKKIERNADAVNGNVLTKEEKTQRIALIDKINDKGYEQVIEEVAYTWFNRFSALRFMEVNNYFPTHIRVFTDEENNFRPQILEEAIHLELDGLDMEKVYSYKEANDNEGLYKYLLITQCNALNKILPGMFQKISDYTELLFPDNLLREGSVIEQMIALIPEEDWKDAVQIIGWLYQYYNTEPKDKVFADLKRNIKISKNKIPAATQLFTPDWIVRYMVENSLGRLWLEGHPNDELQSTFKYYVEEAEQEESVKIELAKIREQYAEFKPEDIKCIDPCMGSGHILVYMFDVLVKIYESYGYTARDAASMIVKNNLYGLDIDDRAAQLSNFAIMMKARQYDRRFFTRDIQPNVYAIQESNNIDNFAIDEFINGNEEIKTNLDSILSDMHDAKEYGSILNVNKVDFKLLYNRLDEVLGDVSIQRTVFENKLLPLIKIAEMLYQEYDIVITNPPYMSNAGMDSKLSNYVKNNYKDSKSDMFSVFIERCSHMSKSYYAMITQPSFMFLSSFEALRKKIINCNTISSLLHMGRGIFGVDFGSTAFVFNSHKSNEYKGSFFRLHERTFQFINPEDIEILFRESNENHNFKYDFSQYDTEVGIMEQKQSSHSLNIYFEISQENFSKIPGSAIAYWVSDSLFNAFNTGKLLQELATPRNGMKTGDNNKFLRLWWEINKKNCCLSPSSFDEAITSNKKWFHYNKGGEFRKWYGNNEYVVNWANEGYDIFKKAKVEKRNVQDYPNNMKFSHSGSWGLISSGKPSFRYKVGNLSDIAGMSFYADKDTVINLLAFCNSIIAEKVLKILAPTINYQAGDIGRLPILTTYFAKPNISSLTCDNIKLSQNDWDSFETSWDFETHPLVRWSKNLLDATAIGATMQHYYGYRPEVSCPLELCFMLWQGECNERFNQLKANEEELNRIFIDIYGLQDELTPEVEDKDVTVRKADLQRDIKSLISYAVGCMFGRYSLDVDGLAYAGGEFDESKYSSYPADADNIIPICDDEYFGDDIVGRFEKFVEIVYGKETLEENLSFIANALGGTGTPREVIRKYFLNDFYADHLKIYQKRPIYWLFDSGKKNGFKALIYMHRYKEDTLARMRTDYVHEQQARYRTAMEDLEQRISNCAASERVRLTKQLNKIKDQDTELRTYEEKIHHLADKMIRIDLDDGVKHNYNIFKDVLAKIK